MSRRVVVAVFGRIEGRYEIGTMDRLVNTGTLLFRGRVELLITSKPSSVKLTGVVGVYVISRLAVALSNREAASEGLINGSSCGC